MFRKAQQDIQGKISALDARTDLQNAQSIAYQKKYQQALLQQVNGSLKVLQSGQYQTVNDYLTKSYQNGYVGCMYSLHHQGIPMIMPIDQEKVTKALTIDSQLSTRYYKEDPLKGRVEENVTLLKNRIRSNISRGLLAGKTWSETAIDLATGMNNPFETAFKDAMRIVRTEGHRVNQQASLDAGSEAKKNGADILKQWDATLDGKTRPWHMVADGQIREWDEPFDVMGENLKPLLLVVRQRMSSTAGVSCSKGQDGNLTKTNLMNFGREQNSLGLTSRRILKNLNRSS